MSQQPLQILISIYRWLIAADRPRNHWRRYILGGVLSCFGVITLSGTYLALMPKTYKSNWSVILPGAGVDARVSLDRIGQTQLSSSSPFSDKALSPKVNYKEIATSRTVLGDAAQRVGLTLKEFGKPRIKLVDQTSIIQFSVYGPSPREAQQRAYALYEALKAKLNALRSDEIRWRNKAIRSNIDDVESNLKAARRKLISLQVGSGLSSLEQYKQLVSSTEMLRRTLASAKADLAEAQTQIRTLSGKLGVPLSSAAGLIALSSDPEFQSLWTAYSAASSKYAENSRRLGAAHPRVLDPQSKMRSVRQSLIALISARSPTPIEQVERLLYSAQQGSYVTLLSRLLSKHAEGEGLKAKISEIETSIDEQEERRKKYGVIAARLDDLQRDHLVANAVFSSAVARIDATKSDIYASYPLLQILEEPTRPEKPSSPRLLFAVIGAFAGCLLATLGWLFAWLHQWFAFIRLRNVSPSMRYA